MKLAIGSDHRGVQTKSALKTLLAAAGHQVADLGTDSEQSVDYPDYARDVTEAVREGQVERGILICGSGIGMSIAANKVSGIRAALCYRPELARLSRQHNDANVLCLAADFTSVDENRDITLTWLETGFEGGRHCRRVEKIAQLGERP